MADTFKVGDRVELVEDSARHAGLGTVAIPRRKLPWIHIEDENDPATWTENRRDDAVQVHWDRGGDDLHLPEELQLVSRPATPTAAIPHEVRRIADRLIEGDIVQDASGNKGTIAIAGDANEDFHIDWVHEGMAITSREGSKMLRLVERPSKRPGEANPDPSLPDARSHRWDRVDVDEDDRSVWIHYSKNLRERLNRVDVVESEESVTIEIFLSRVPEIDERWTEAVRYGPIDTVPECTRLRLRTALGKRVCLELLHDQATGTPRSDS